MSLVYAKLLCVDYGKLTCMTLTCEDVRMATGTLVAKIRAHKTAQERLEQARQELDQEIARAVNSREWQIIDVAEVTGWSRETIRAIIKRVNDDADPADS